MQKEAGYELPHKEIMVDRICAGGCQALVLAANRRLCAQLYAQSKIATVSWEVGEVAKAGDLQR